MAFSKEYQDRIMAALPRVEFNAIKLHLKDYRTVVEFLYDDNIVATLQVGKIQNGDALILNGLTGKLPIGLRFDPYEP